MRLSGQAPADAKSRQQAPGFFGFRKFEATTSWRPWRLLATDRRRVLRVLGVSVDGAHRIFETASRFTESSVGRVHDSRVTCPRSPALLVRSDLDTPAFDAGSVV